MGCLLALAVVLSPRLALLFLWLFTNLVDRAFAGGPLGGFLVPLLGLAFLPVTTIVYALVWGPAGLVGADWFWLGLGLLADVTASGGGAYGSRRR